jgi:hypothetical protein
MDGFSAKVRTPRVGSPIYPEIQDVEPHLEHGYS